MSSGEKLTKLLYLGDIKNGKFYLSDAARKRMALEISKIKDTENVRLTFTPEAKPKTHKQLGFWYAAIIPQIQDFYQTNEGRYIGADHLTDDLCAMFLKPVPQYYSDGSPVMLKVAHPEKKNVFYQWHFEKTPRPDSLDKEQFSSLIDAVLTHFQHEKNYLIKISP